MRKSIYISTLLIFIGFIVYKVWRQDIGFPDFEYHEAYAISINRNTSEDSLLVYNKKSRGLDFLDTNGNVIHNNIKKYKLSKKELSNIDRCLKKGSLLGESMTDCVPIFRDAIVYYDTSNKPVGWISICFQCEKLYFNSKSVFFSNESLSCINELFQNYNDIK